jgi:phosphatidylinositol alpha-mannosyltransferase
LQRLLSEHRFDLLHAHEPCVPSLALSSVLVAGIPAVGTFHAAGVRSLPYSVFSPVAGLVIERLAGKIAVSEAARSFVAGHFPGDYRIVPNGVVPEAYAEALSLPAVKGRLLFIGRAEPRKGLVVLLQALRRVRREIPWVSLRVIGIEQAQLRSLVSRGWPPLDWPLPGVEALGRVSQAEKVRALGEAELLVVPSLQGESFGVVLVEALAAGVPVVASDLRGYRSVLRNGELGALVPPGDPEDLARALLGLLRDSPRRQLMADRGVLAARDYAWSEVAEMVLSVYEEALYRGSVAPARRNGSRNGSTRSRHGG